MPSGEEHLIIAIEQLRAAGATIGEYDGKPTYRPGPNTRLAGVPFPDWDGTRYVEGHMPVFALNDDSASLRKAEASKRAVLVGADLCGNATCCLGEPCAVHDMRS